MPRIKTPQAPRWPPRGTPNKASVERQAEVASTGATPLATMIAKMRFHLAAAESFCDTCNRACGPPRKLPI